MNNSSPPPAEQPAPYANLTPDLILQAVESANYRCDGRLLGLNSYENRVYQIGIEDEQPLIAKFYRPARWSDAAILEEHAFSQELAEREIPVVAPLANAGGATLHRFEGFRFALYPRRAGRAPELDDVEVLEWLGRFLGRIHAVGATRRFEHRPSLDVHSFGDEPLQYLLENDFIPIDLLPAYRSTADDLLQRVRQIFDAAGAVTAIRLHGDCHPGNVLWRDGPHFVDFDDCRMGPALQDIWMLLSGDRAAMTRQLGYVLDGYQDFCEFNFTELHLLEALRSLRMLHYSAWLARRWNDPAFPLNFPWFNTQQYWQDQILALREQRALLDEPPLNP